MFKKVTIREEKRKVWKKSGIGEKVVLVLV